jgi:hypothetical protein
LGLASVTESEAQAARMLASSTSAPLKYPTYLNDRGRVLSESSSTHSLAAKDKSKAAYVAFKLAHGSAVAKTVPLMKARSPVGPDARQIITAVASGVGRIAVKTPKGLFLVGNYRPKSALASHKTPVKHKAAASAGHKKASTSHIAVKAQAQHLAGTGAKKAAAHHAAGVKVARTDPATSPVGEVLKLNPPKAAPTVTRDDHGNPLPDPLQVTTSTPSPSTSSGLTLVPADAGTHHEAPVPEPGTLAFAGLAIGGAILRAGLRRRRIADLPAS